MKPNCKLVWRLTAMVAAILTVAIGRFLYVHNLTCGHFSLASAWAFLQLNSESFVEGIGDRRMAGPTGRGGPD